MEYPRNRRKADDSYRFDGFAAFNTAAGASPWRVRHQKNLSRPLREALAKFGAGKMNLLPAGESIGHLAYRSAPSRT